MKEMRKASEIVSDALKVKQLVLDDPALLERVESVAEAIIKSYSSGGMVLFCGNGGSAADAQHLAAELSGRFYYDRNPLDAEALHVNTSYLTAVANDYHYDEVYSRLVRAKGRRGAVLIALSTSGNSPNIIKAVTAAKEIGMTVVGFTGESGGKMRDVCDFLINVPSSDTPRIQEVHILLGHIVCEIVESQIFPR